MNCPGLGMLWGKGLKVTPGINSWHKNVRDWDSTDAADFWRDLQINIKTSYKKKKIRCSLDSESFFLFYLGLFCVESC